MKLYHYFDQRTGPFRNLSDLPEEQAKKLLESIRAERPASLCARRDEEYLAKRRRCEAIIREEFLRKGGRAERKSPHYMVVEHCPWLAEWYERSDCLCIPIEQFDTNTLSFTYGDSMPTFSPRVNDGREYRRQLYTYEEILGVIEKYDLPQHWNADGRHGPERYVEVHIWTDDTIAACIAQYEKKKS